MEAIIFYSISVVTIAAAILVVANKSPIGSAICLVATLFGVAALFVSLEAHFVAVMQVILYTGAIMVLFIFVIMLLNLRENQGSQVRWPTRLIGGMAGVLLGGIILFLLTMTARTVFLTESVSTIGNVEEVGMLLLSKYGVPFEVTSIVLLIAVIGAVYLGKRGSL